MKSRSHDSRVERSVLWILFFLHLSETDYCLGEASSKISSHLIKGQGPGALQAPGFTPGTQLHSGVSLSGNKPHSGVSLGANKNRKAASYREEVRSGLKTEHKICNWGNNGFRLNRNLQNGLASAESTRQEA